MLNLREFFPGGRSLHFFGPAALPVLREVVSQIQVEGGDVQEWLIGEKHPLPEQTDTPYVLWVKLRGQLQDADYWGSVLPWWHSVYRKFPNMILVGVSEDDTVPRAWKFHAHARIEISSETELRVVKDKLTKANYQAQSFRREPGFILWEPVLGEGLASIMDAAL
jgi:hypothetical protein